MRTSNWIRILATPGIWLLLGCLIAGVARGSPALNQKDTFQDGTPQNWTNGVGAPDPLNIATGGPAGAGDRYLQISSTGIGSAGSRPIIFNNGQWTGAYPAAAAAIEMDLRSFGSADLMIRIALRDTQFNQFATADGSAFLLHNDGAWHHVSFGLTDASMANLGFGNLASALGSVGELRILHSAFPSYTADPIAANIGVDNITLVAAPEPGAAGGALSMLGLMLGGRRLRHRPRH